MTTAQVIHELGPPSAMQWEDSSLADPGPGEVRLLHTAVGVNFAGKYHSGGISHRCPVPAHEAIRSGTPLGAAILIP